MYTVPRRGFPWLPVVDGPMTLAGRISLHPALQKKINQKSFNYTTKHFQTSCQNPQIPQIPQVINADHHRPMSTRSLFGSADSTWVYQPRPKKRSSTKTRGTTAEPSLTCQLQISMNYRTTRNDGVIQRAVMTLLRGSGAAGASGSSCASCVSAGSFVAPDKQVLFKCAV